MYDVNHNNETPATIYEWGLAVFGQPISPLASLVRTQEEMTELLTEIVKVSGDPARVAEEAADVVIILARVAGQLGLSLTWNTEWKSDSLIGSATAANLILARLIANPLASGDTKQRQFGHDLHWIASHMARVCEFVARDLQTEINSKMALNRASKFVVTGNGNGARVKNSVHHLALIDNSDSAFALREMRDRGPYGPGVTALSYGADNRQADVA